ncbi:dihydroxyacetone kinase subunit DhaK [Peterkaempfera bronchialis]|uniref:Dihydroxyacetone kinase subunit DhaK n=1 Tax=Peterkaempfera bronchialis TaxID=2126346 RepID=A0A345SRJ1_9ACTN|nr:dihydroxyacetone kinase subunit DhaK [Peterkaempfera bronchialis]AXI76346.1 dihydroxyacetone kinase subunit DhaK [Peterkaempfera bronchialis]
MAQYFANAPDTLVDDALAGFARAHAGLVVHDTGQAFVRARHGSPTRRVGLLSGGGSGHEPLHIGFVGAGMLDAACPGRVFASPHNRQIFEASRAVARQEGVLHIVKNYTGDRINFGIAAERLAHAGIACRRVLVDDDTASDSDDIAAGRRGTAATVLVEKVLGAAADTGRGLDDLAELGASLASRCRTVAVASAAQTVPTTGRPAFALDPGLVEFGVGIHGERADRSLRQEPLGALVERMAAALLDALRPPPGTPLIALVNGLGAVTLLELYAAYNELARVLEGSGLTVARSRVGNLVTALDMRGFSLSLLLADEETLALFDAPVQTPVWQW